LLGRQGLVGQWRSCSPGPPLSSP